jgi:hypothetical protein
VVFAAFFNFVAIFIFHLSVAATVGKGIVQPGVVDTHVVFGALVGAITWNVHHLVLRYPQQFLACADWRHRGCGDGQGRARVRLMSAGIMKRWPSSSCRPCWVSCWVR